MSKKMAYPEFVKRAMLIHKNKYTYVEGSFNGSHCKIIIKCPIHGFFSQMPRKHIYQGQGCPKCAKIATGALKKLSTNDFIKKALKVHGNEYDYSNSIYVSSRSTVDILCRKHGIFKQNSHMHLLGEGCPLCRYEKSAMSNINKVKKGIIDRFVGIHKDTYDYSSVKYKGMRKKVSIICRKHGLFKQTPNNHLMGAGCPLCYNKSRGEKFIADYLYSSNIYFIRQKKFSGCVNKRKLPFDFFLPDLNICIEYDGIIHFEPKFGVDSLLKTNINDNIKNKFCQDKGIKLVRVPYMIKNIPDFLDISLNPPPIN